MSEGIQAALKTAIASGDLSSAIEENKLILTAQEISLLQSITPDELTELVKLESKARNSLGMSPLDAIDSKAQSGDVHILKDWIGGIW